MPGGFLRAVPAACGVSGDRGRAQSFDPARYGAAECSVEGCTWCTSDPSGLCTEHRSGRSRSREALASRVLAEARDWEKSAMLRSGNGEQSPMLPFLRAVKELAVEVIRAHDTACTCTPPEMVHRTGCPATADASEPTS